MSTFSRRNATKALGAAVFGAAAVVEGKAKAAANVGVVDPVVALWAQTQALNAEWDRISTEQSRLRELIISRNPAQPKGVAFDEWYCADPETARCGSLRSQSDNLGNQTCDLYDKIADAVAVSPEGIRAKAAAALSLFVQEQSLREDMWHYDLILNALREAAAGSAV